MQRDSVYGSDTIDQRHLNEGVAKFLRKWIERPPHLSHRVARSIDNVIGEAVCHTNMDE